MRRRWSSDRSSSCSPPPRPRRPPRATSSSSARPASTAPSAASCAPTPASSSSRRCRSSAPSSSKPPPASRAEALAALRADADVVYAEPDRRSASPARPTTPTSARSGRLKNTGQIVAARPAPPAPTSTRTTAWDQSEGAGVTVAVVDTGINADHVDLVDQITGNPAEIDGTPGVDDDGNGYVDDYRGWDFVSGDNLAAGRPRPRHARLRHDRRRRATTASGVIGVAPGAKVLPLRALDDNGSGYMSDDRRRVRLRRRPRRPDRQRLARRRLLGRCSRRVIAAHPNTLYVVAAGNDAPTPTRDARRLSRARCRRPTSSASARPTTATTSPSFSNYGATAVDLFAPGRAASSRPTRARRPPTRPGRHVDGVAARRRRRRARARRATRPPRPSFLRYALLSSVDARPALSGLAVTGGRLNANGAVDAIQGAEPAPAPTPTPDADARRRRSPRPTPAPPVAPPAPRRAGRRRPPRRPRRPRRALIDAQRSAARCAPRRASCASPSGSRARAPVRFTVTRRGSQVRARRPGPARGQRRRQRLHAHAQAADRQDPQARAPTRSLGRAQRGGEDVSSVDPRPREPRAAAGTATGGRPPRRRTRAARACSASRQLVALGGRELARAARQLAACGGARPGVSAPR